LQSLRAPTGGRQGGLEIDGRDTRIFGPVIGTRPALGRPPSTTKTTIRASTDEPADLALHLGSAESDGMTRQTLLLDGGMLME